MHARLFLCWCAKLVFDCWFHSAFSFLPITFVRSTVCQLYLPGHLKLGMAWQGRYVKNGCLSITGQALRRFWTSPRSGCGPTIMIAPILPWAVSPQSSVWPWLHNCSTSQISGNWGDYHHPFFGTLALFSEFKVTDDVETAATNGKVLWFNPLFFDKQRYASGEPVLKLVT
jgi:hypothetical protein